MIVKYKLSEVAKDLGMGNKEIADILKEYATAPKSNSQVLSEKELNIIFDAVSQKNQIDSLEQVFAPAAAAAEERKRQNEERIRAQQEAREAERRAQERAREEAQERTRPQKQQAQKRPETRTLERKPVESSQAEAPVQTKAPKVHYVDTRGSSVNIERYDERMETLVPEKAQRISAQQSKQKLTKQSQKRSPYMGNKRRQEEQEKMRRLQQQAMAKKVPLKVMIPDEIAVGELALRT